MNAPLPEVQLRPDGNGEWHEWHEWHESHTESRGGSSPPPSGSGGCQPGIGA
jgi:hypothetical protein